MQGKGVICHCMQVNEESGYKGEGDVSDGEGVKYSYSLIPSFAI